MKKNTSHDTIQDAGGRLLGLDGVDGGRIRGLLESAKVMAETGGMGGAGEAGEELAGKTVGMLFFENSTRTRMSFGLAVQMLGARVLEMEAQGSSLAKGESLVDTALTIESMGVDGLVVRCAEAGGAWMIAQHTKCAVVNAGDGRHEHPTQGLIDLYAFAHAHGRADSWDLSGLTLGIVGDVVNSRVARSAIAGFTTLGARVVCIGPVAMVPEAIRCLGCEVERDLDGVIGGMGGGMGGGLDGVMMLRVQFERHGGDGLRNDGAGRLDYRTRYAMTVERAARLGDGAVVMHPGPMNAGLEIDLEVARGEAGGGRSLIREQVAAGVAVRMAVLEEVISGKNV